MFNFWIWRPFWRPFTMTRLRVAQADEARVQAKPGAFQKSLGIYFTPEAFDKSIEPYQVRRYLGSFWLTFKAVKYR